MVELKVSLKTLVLDYKNLTRAFNTVQYVLPFVRIKCHQQDWQKKNKCISNILLKTKGKLTAKLNVLDSDV